MRHLKKANEHRAPFLFHLSTHVYIETLRTAKQQGLPLGTFVDAALHSACANAGQNLADGIHERPESVSLFLTIANTSPERLTGKWRHLYYQIKQDPTLWRTERVTVGQLDDGMSPGVDFIDASALERAWPRLVLNSFPD